MGGQTPAVLTVAVENSYAIRDTSSFSLTLNRMAWFDKYTVKPPWQPPNKVFTIVWPILYVIYTITLYTQWKKTPIRNALLLGLILNFCWVPVFTVNAVAALAVLTAMIIVGIQSLLLLKKEGGYAVWLFSPYVLWISFAWTLNAYIAVKN